MPSKKTGKIIAIRTKFKNPLKAWKRNNPLHGRSPAAGIHVVSAQILGLQGLPAPGLQASTAATPSRYWARDVSDAIQISAPLVQAAVDITPIAGAPIKAAIGECDFSPKYYS